MPRKRRGLPITDDVIAEMWELYEAGRSINFIAKQCNVSHVTVRKYRNKLKWDERLNTIRARANRRADETAIQRRVRHLNELKLIQSKAVRFLQGEHPEDKTIKSDATAVQAVLQAVALERKICGDEGQTIEAKITITLPDGYEDL